MRAAALSLILTLACSGCLLGDGDDSQDGPVDPLPAECVSKTYPVATFCGPEQWRYTDQVCPAGGVRNDAGMTVLECREAGDRSCYDFCLKDSDCLDPCRPFCARMYLFRGTDNGGDSQGPAVCTARQPF